MNFMCTESMRLTWKSEGLPADDLSVENALVIQNSMQAALIVDPSQTVPSSKTKPRWHRGRMTGKVLRN